MPELTPHMSRKPRDLNIPEPYGLQVLARGLDTVASLAAKVNEDHMKAEAEKFKTKAYVDTFDFVNSLQTRTDYNKYIEDYQGVEQNLQSEFGQLKLNKDLSNDVSNYLKVLGVRGRVKVMGETVKTQSRENTKSFLEQHELLKNRAHNDPDKAGLINRYRSMAKGMAHLDPVMVQGRTNDFVNNVFLTSAWDYVSNPNMEYKNAITWLQSNPVLSIQLSESEKLTHHITPDESSYLQSKLSADRARKISSMKDEKQKKEKVAQLEFLKMFVDDSQAIDPAWIISNPDLDPFGDGSMEKMLSMVKQRNKDILEGKAKRWKTTDYSYYNRLLQDIYGGRIKNPKDIILRIKPEVLGVTDAEHLASVINTVQKREDNPIYKKLDQALKSGNKQIVTTAILGKPAEALAQRNAYEFSKHLEREFEDAIASDKDPLELLKPGGRVDQLISLYQVTFNDQVQSQIEFLGNENPRHIRKMHETPDQYLKRQLDYIRNDLKKEAL